MTQNIYDNSEFFAGYSRLGRSIDGLDGAAEWPALRAMLPDLHGRAVIDLGCGFGWFCRWARANGADRVVGLDVSERMLARAKADTSDKSIIYARADLENFELSAAPFYLAYSSLVLHYLPDLDRFIATVRSALEPGGHLVFSVEHPIYTAPSTPGWAIDAAGRKTWPIEGYLNPGPRRTDWLTKGVIKQHRTISAYLNALLRHGFSILHIEEWGPDDVQIAARPELVDERQRPPFLLVSAQNTR